MRERLEEFAGLTGSIEECFQSDELIKKEESTRKLLLQQINVLKNHFKVEVNSREVADKEIGEALDTYQDIIEKQVIKHREEIKKK